MATKEQSIFVIVKGYFSSLNKYNQLEFTLAETEYKKLQEETKDLTGKSPLSTWTTYNDTIKYNLKVALKPAQKSVFANFNKIANQVGNLVRFAGEITTYDFKSKEGEQVKGWKMTLNGPLVMEKVMIQKDLQLKEAALKVEQEMKALSESKDLKASTPDSDEE